MGTTVVALCYPQARARGGGGVELALVEATTVGTSVAYLFTCLGWLASGTRQPITHKALTMIGTTAAGKGIRTGTTLSPREYCYGRPGIPVRISRKVHFPVHNPGFRPISTSFLVQNDVPPPGAYFRRSTLERDGRVCGSVSMKGYGSGFVSAAPRFRDVQTLQQAHLPGPGSYMVPSETGQEGGKLTSFSSLRRVRPGTNSATDDAIDLRGRRLPCTDSGELVYSPLPASEIQGLH